MTRLTFRKLRDLYPDAVWELLRRSPFAVTAARTNEPGEQGRGVSILYAGFESTIAAEVMLDPSSGFAAEDVAYVFRTGCGNADQVCPMFPGQVNRHHWGFDDPAHATGSKEEQMVMFRRVRDEIRERFEAYAAERKAAVAKAPVL